MGSRKTPEEKDCPELGCNMLRDQVHRRRLLNSGAKFVPGIAVLKTRDEDAVHGFELLVLESGEKLSTEHGGEKLLELTEVTEDRVSRHWTLQMIFLSHARRARVRGREKRHLWGGKRIREIGGVKRS